MQPPATSEIGLDQTVSVRPVGFEVTSQDAMPTQASMPAPVVIGSPRQSEAGGQEWAELKPSDRANAESNIAASALEPLGFSINLPTALALVGGNHPVVAVAKWRVQEAYANLDRARVMWLPSIQPGFSFHRHDGNYQASNGDIIDVNRNSFQYGLGNNATGAGTTPTAGLSAQFHLADAIFEPEIAKHQAWARGHASTSVVNQQLRDASIAYLNFLRAHQDRSIMRQSQGLVDELVTLTTSFAQAGAGLQSDADRLQTEAAMVAARLNQSEEAVAVSEARLAQVLSLDGVETFSPAEPTLVPITFAEASIDGASLIQIGLTHRPELKESQNLVAAACEEYHRQKISPFVPSVLLGFSSGGFGGGLGNELENVDGRYDLDAAMTWRVRNLGFGEQAERRRAASQVQRAKYEKLRLMDEVVRQVDQSHRQVRRRGERIEIAQRAIGFAQDSFDRNLSRIRDGQGLPIEALQSVRALEESRRLYLAAVADHNEAQFQLQWALGWAITAP